MKGQVALEFMLVIVIGLSLLLPFAYYGFTSFTDNVKISTAANAVASITNNVDKEYSFGAGSETVITITMPDGININRTGINGSLASIGVTLSNGGTTDVTSKSKTTMIGFLPNSTGTFPVKIRVLRNGSVQVGEIMQASPNSISKIVSPNNPETFTLANVAPPTFGNVNNVNLVAEGRVADVINNIDAQGTPIPIPSLPPTANIRINFKAGSPSGTYEGIIFINSSNGGEVQVSLNVTLS